MWRTRWGGSGPGMQAGQGWVGNTEDQGRTGLSGPKAEFVADGGSRIEAGPGFLRARAWPCRERIMATCQLDGPFSAGQLDLQAVLEMFSMLHLCVPPPGATDAAEAAVVLIVFTLHSPAQPRPCPTQPTPYCTQLMRPVKFLP